MSDSVGVRGETVEAVARAIYGKDRSNVDFAWVERKMDAQSAITALLASGEVVTSGEVDELVKAGELAERWLMNCMPIVSLEGPKPLPVLRKALARFQPKQSSKEAL